MKRTTFNFYHIETMLAHADNAKNSETAKKCLAACHTIPAQSAGKFCNTNIIAITEIQRLGFDEKEVCLDLKMLANFSLESWKNDPTSLCPSFTMIPFLVLPPTLPF